MSDDAPEWLKRLSNQREFTRRMIPLLPGEPQPTYALGIDPTPGFRWETDAELRERISLELEEKAKKL